MKKKTDGSHGSSEARALMARYPAIDLHADTLMWARWTGYDLRRRHRPPLPKSAYTGHVDIPRLADGLVGAQFFGLVTLPLGPGKCAAAVESQATKLELACATDDRLAQAVSAAEIEQINAAGKIAALLGVEGAHALDGELDNVAVFAELGVRYLGLAHFSANEACRPAKGLGSDPDAGLTPFGCEVIGACEERGIILDLAHLNDVGFAETVCLARRPFIVSHAGIAGAHRHWRNLADWQLQAVANSGGVVGIMFVPNFLGGPGLNAVIRHMEHVICTVGEDHVALGSDYDGMVVPTPELAEISRLPNLTDAMLRAGWSEKRIGKILRQNVLRVLRDVPPQN